jgi:hypothetical protein
MNATSVEVLCEPLMRVGMSRVEDDMGSGYVQQPGMVTCARLYGLRQGMIPSNHNDILQSQIFPV